MLPLAVGSVVALLLGQPVERCALCARDPGVPVVHLAPGEALQFARAFAAENEVRLGRIDSLLHQGRLGPPGSDAARRRAQLLARVSLRNLYAHLFRYAADPERVVEADEASLRSVFATFSEPSLFPLAHLQRVRMGLSHVCVQYDLDGPAAGHTRLGGLDLPYRIENQLVDGRLRRLLVVDWPSTSAGTTQLLLAAHYGFRVEHLRSAGPPAYEAFLVEDVRGGWLRRWGVHRPDAFVFWASTLDEPEGGLPDAPLVGVRIYIPGLHLELPVLPDIALDDLRALDLPTPFLALSSFRDGRLPSWLEVDGRMNLRDWRGVGPVPAAVQQRFPNR